MPNFSNGNLSPEEKRDVIAYLRRSEETPGYGGFSLGGLGPVSEGLFAWVVGIGGLVGLRDLDRGPHHALTKQKAPAGAPRAALSTTTST